MPATDGKSLDDAAKWRFGHDESRTAQAEIAGLNRRLSEPSRHRR
jgi:hypothetical protein